MNTHSLKLNYIWNRIIPNFSFESWRSIPSEYMAPGVYRWSITRANGDTSYYIGESVNLRRRIRNYSVPGPNQMTSLRINKLFKTELKRKSKILLELIDLKELRVDNKVFSKKDLKSSYTRKLIENLVLVEHSDLKVHNL
ncbi:MAG: hypothetical protein AAB351_01030 [Patescibacteria group bacterium]